MGLTPEQEADAIKYNRRQWGEGIGVEGLQCRRIQRTVDADVDGRWGPQTVNLAAIWQDEHGLAADGMVGPATSGIMVVSCDELRVSVWCKRSLSEWAANFDSYVATLHELEAENIALVINRQTDTGWSLSRWDNQIDALMATARALEGEGFSVTYTVFPQPDDAFMAAMLQDLSMLVHAPALEVEQLPQTWAEIELDVEGYNWPDDADEAGAAYQLELGLRWPSDRWPDICVTTHVVRMQPGYTITTTVDELAVQAYSYYGPPERAWCADEGPGQRQQNGIAACWDVIGARRRPGRIIVGLAAYDQEYPESAGCGVARGGTESVLEALYAALSRRQTRVRFWHLRHIQENPWVLEAVAQYRAFRGELEV